MTIHIPVLLEEVLEKLAIKPGDVVVDATLGGGGYSIEILKKLSEKGTLIAIDRDPKAVSEFEKKISQNKYPVKVITICDNFANLENICQEHSISQVDKIVADLGFSSDQIEDPKRGFSFQKDGPLEMTYSEDRQKSAAFIVNSYSFEELKDIIRDYGEERNASKIAKAITEKREQEPIETTRELADIISSVSRYKKGQRIHPATKTFQALRIEANQELEKLDIFLDQAITQLASEGILAVVTFHSLEDRIVKKRFNLWKKGCVCPPTFPTCQCGKQSLADVLTRKPIKPQPDEIERNPRARSAKLRAVKKK